MANTLFKILDEYSLLKTNKRLDMLLSMKPTDYTEFLDKLQNILPKWESIDAQNINNPFNLWLPYPNEVVLEQLTNYSFLFEKIYLVDPLSDLCSLMEMDDAENSNYIEFLDKQLGFLKNPVVKMAHDWIGEKDYKVTHLMRLISAGRISKIIESYIQNRELIEEGVIIPFDEPPLQDDVDLAMSVGVKLVVDSIERNPEILNSVRAKIKYATKDQSINTLTDSNEYAILVYEWLEITRFLLTTSAFKTTFPSEKSSSIELGDKNNQLYINRIIELGVPYIGDNAHLISNIRWPKPEDELMITSIKGIPPHKILEIRHKEQHAIEKFRYKARLNLEEMRLSAKDNNYPQLIRTFQMKQKEQVSEIKLLAEHIKKDHLRKIAHEISLMAFSAGGAILSASLATQNPTSLIGVGVAGAGFSKGISSLVETWISYQEKMDALQNKDNYILWRVQAG